MRLEQTGEEVQALFAVLAQEALLDTVRLLDEGPLSMRELADAAGVSLKTMRRRLQCLERQGLVWYRRVEGVGRRWMLRRHGLGPAIDWLETVADLRKAAQDLGLVGVAEEEAAPWEPPRGHVSA